MARGLRTAPEVIAIAKNLGLQGNDPVAAVIRYCRAQVDGWLEAFGGPTTLQRFHQVIAERLSIHHVVITSDQELEDTISEYTQKKEVAFGTLRAEFTSGTQAITFKLRHPGRGVRRHVAVVDGRGERFQRVYFGKRHEDSHLLSISPTQLDLVFRRTHATLPNAEEALMDRIGGELAFYPPVFGPELRRLQRRYGRPCLQLIQDLRESVCPEASYIATAIAMIEQNEQPALLLEGRHASKQRALASSTWALRVGRLRGSNSANAAGLMIPWNYRIPRSSVISQVFHHDASAQTHADERLGTWTSSTGSALTDVPIHVEARLYGSNVLAVITLE